MDVVVDLRPVGDLENVRPVVTEKSLTTPPLSYLKHERQLLFYRRLLRSDNIVYLFTRFFTTPSRYRLHIPSTALPSWSSRISCGHRFSFFCFVLFD